LKRTIIMLKPFRITEASILRFFLIWVLATGITGVEPARAQISAQTGSTGSRGANQAALPVLDAGRGHLI